MINRVNPCTQVYYLHYLQTTRELSRNNSSEGFISMFVNGKVNCCFLKVKNNNS